MLRNAGKISVFICFSLTFLTGCSIVEKDKFSGSAKTEQYGAASEVSSEIKVNYKVLEF